MNLTQFNAMRLEDFSSWLVERLSAAYGDDLVRRNMAFDLMEIGILHWESPIDAIRRLSILLDLDARPRLRRALGFALKQVDTASFPVQGVTDLVMLVGVLEAHESLDAVVTVVGDGGKWGDIEPSLWIDAISVLKGLQGSDASYHATRKIVAAPAFPDRYVFDAYEALVTGKPERWVKDFLLLEPRFKEIMGWRPTYWDRPIGWFDYRMSNIVEKCLARLSLQTIADKLKVMDQMNNLLDIEKPLGKLARHMFCRGPFQHYSIDHGEITFGLRNHTARENWPPDLDSLDTFLWSIGGLHSDPHDMVESIKRAATKDEETRELVERCDHFPAANDPRWLSFGVAYGSCS